MLKDKLLKEGSLWSTFVEEMVDYGQRYFAMDRLTVETYLEKKFYDYDATDWGQEEKRRRLGRMLDVVLPYCDLFAHVTDDKTKRKVGQVFFSKLDYAQFGDEPVRETYERLDRLFRQIDKKGINPYKIIYNQVLTDGNLKRDKETGRKRYYESRDFDNIYFTIKRRFGLTDEETNEMFEKCSSLISKASSIKINEVATVLENIVYFLPPPLLKAFHLLSTEERKNIIKLNPSLLCGNPKSIKDAYDYINAKAAAYLRGGKIAIENLHENAELNFAENKLILLRGWLKNNSSMLLINADSMRAKEKYVRSAFGERYRDQFAAVFCDPINICIINQLPEKKVFENAGANIATLEKYVSKEEVAKYIEKNIYVLAMDKLDFGVLLETIAKEDSENPESELLAKFLKAGKSVFAGSADFKIPDIVAKLKTNTLVEDLGFEEMSEKECLAKFLEIFMHDDPDTTQKLLRLMKEQEERNIVGEKILRKNIRTIAGNIRGLSKILKDPNAKLAEKERRILSLRSNLEVLKGQRLTLANESTISGASIVELEISRDIEETLNKLRNSYEKKQSKMVKKYAGVERLFVKTMNYLDECFDDKRALPYLFRDEVVKAYVDMLESSFETSEPDQITFFDRNIVVKIPERTLRSNIKGLHNDIVEADTTDPTASIFFEK